MEVTLTAIKRTPRISKKTGKPFVSVGIKTNQHGDAWLSGFASAENADWEEGHTVSIDVEQKGEYLNFTAAKEERDSSASPAGVSEIKNMLTFKVIPMLEAIYKQNPPLKAPAAYDVEAADKLVEDSPF